MCFYYNSAPVGNSKLITTRTPRMSRPRPARSVASRKSAYRPRDKDSHRIYRSTLAATANPNSGTCLAVAELLKGKESLLLREVAVQFRGVEAYQPEDDLRRGRCVRNGGLLVEGCGKAHLHPVGVDL